MSSYLGTFTDIFFNIGCEENSVFIDITRSETLQKQCERINLSIQELLKDKKPEYIIRDVIGKIANVVLTNPLYNIFKIKETAILLREKDISKEYIPGSYEPSKLAIYSNLYAEPNEVCAIFIDAKFSEAVAISSTDIVYKWNIAEYIPDDIWNKELRGFTYTFKSLSDVFDVLSCSYSYPDVPIKFVGLSDECIFIPNSFIRNWALKIIKPSYESDGALVNSGNNGRILNVLVGETYLI